MPMPDDAAIPFRILIYACIIRGFIPRVNRYSHWISVLLYATAMDNDDRKKDHPWVPYAWIILVVFSALIVLIALPHMREAFRESQMGALVQRYRMEQRDAEQISQTARVFFAVPKSQGDGFSFVPYSVPTTSGSRFAVVEALLAGPPHQALQNGAITCIPSGTKLRGMSVSYEIAFVDFSQEFLAPTVWENEGIDGKIGQVRRTLTALQGIRDVVILVEGTPLEEISTSR